MKTNQQENEVKLFFSNTKTTCLVGYKNGKKTYENQIKNRININEVFTIYFPNEKDIISSSFIEGMFEEIINKIGISNLENRLRVHTVNNQLLDKLVMELFMKKYSDKMYNKNKVMIKK